MAALLTFLQSVSNQIFCDLSEKKKADSSVARDAAYGGFRPNADGSSFEFAALGDGEPDRRALPVSIREIHHPIAASTVARVSSVPKPFTLVLRSTSGPPCSVHVSTNWSRLQSIGYRCSPPAWHERAILGGVGRKFMQEQREALSGHH